MKKILIPLCALVLTGCKTEPSSTVDVSTPEGVLEVLENASKEGKILFGHQDDTAYGHGWNGEDGRSDVKEVCGDYPAVLGWDLGGVELGDADNLDRIPFDRMRRLIVEHYEQGGINTVSWHAFNPITGGNSWDISCDTVVRAVLSEGETGELFKEWLGRTADFLESLKTTDGTLVPVIFRPWHEHTGSWFWWGNNFCTPEEFKALWRLTADYLRKERGLDNLILAYSPNLDADREKYMEAYPGDEYVDLLGFDIYHFDGEKGAQKYMEDLRYSLGILQTLGRELDKPVALTETGCEGVPMERWWTDVFYKAVKDTKISYVLVWRNAWDRPEHFYGPYPGQLSAENFKEFYKLPQTVFLKDIGKN